MQTVDEFDDTVGLRPATDDERRYVVEFIFTTPQILEDGLRAMWKDKTPLEAEKILRQGDIVVTSKKDKDLHLDKLLKLDQKVKATLAREVQSSALAHGTAGNRRCSDTAGNRRSSAWLGRRHVVPPVEEYQARSIGARSPCARSSGWMSKVVADRHKPHEVEVWHITSTWTLTALHTMG